MITENLKTIKLENVKRISDQLSKYDIDTYGIASLRKFKSGSDSVPAIARPIIDRYKYAIVIGARFQRPGKNTSGFDTSLFLEKIAFGIMLHIIEKEKRAALIVHTEDEFLPGYRRGLLPLKALAKEAGIGWQGRSLLIVSPAYGPLHRLIGILTDLPLAADRPVKNQCNDCYLCIEKCPSHALKPAEFTDHPEKREDVIDIERCSGDSGCVICITACPWFKNNKNA